MNDEVKQGEVIQAAERESEQRATNAQLAAEPARAETAPGGAAQTESRAAERPQAEAAQGDAPQGDAEAQRAESAAEVPQVPDQDNPEFRELQQAVAEGRDLSKELEPPAAGEGGGSSDSIAAGVRFERDPNARDPRAGFDPDYTPPPLPDPTANTSPVVAVVEPPPPPPDNGVAIGGLTPAAEGGDVSVNEAHLTDGSAPNPPALTQTGSFTVSAPDGLGSLTIGGVLVLDANGLTGNPVTTPLGNTLLVTGYDPVTGEVTYEYTLGDNESHPPGQGANDLFDNLPVVLTDSDGDTTEQQLAVRIVDDLPNAISDIDEVGTGGSTGGNVFTGTDDDPLDRVEADVPGADRTASPITGVIAGEHLDAPITDGSGVGAVIDGQFGTLVLNADGSYVYTADGGLVSNQTEVFTYTLTDADGDTDTATLTIRIQGEAPPPPPPPPPDNPVDISDLTPAGEGGDASVNEANLSDGSAPNPPALTQTGTFTISVPDGLGSLTIGGVVVLNAGGLTGATVTTPLGNTLVVTGYNPATGVVSYEYTLGDNEGHPLGDGTNDLFDQMPVVLTDSDGDTDSDTLSVRIVDDVPTAVDDTDSIAAGSVGPALGNVISDAEGDGGAD
ncbi:MAG: Ig-like domain-containing protein, partial [Pseudomonadota bacterium]